MLLIFFSNSSMITGSILPTLTANTSAPSSSSLDMILFSPCKALSSSMYGTTIFLPNSVLFSKKFSLSCNVTTSPTTIVAGDFSFVCSIFASIFSKVPMHLLWIGVVPLEMTAIGVSALLPALISPAAILFTCASPIKNHTGHRLVGKK